MKLLFLLVFVGFSVFFADAQNVQLHYDMGKERGYFTSTVEMFKPDNWGNTYFFIDMDYDVGTVKGISLAYWEISRAINLGKSAFAFHAEYNGGFGQYKPGGSYQIEDAWLTGFEYSWNAPDFSKGFTLQTLYKYIRGKHNASFQLTGVWYLNFASNKLSFSGFADLWREDFVFGNVETKFVFLTEPQIWYNFNKNLALGSEVELSSNFAGMKGFHVMPTLAAKLTF